MGACDTWGIQQLPFTPSGGGQRGHLVDRWLSLPWWVHQPLDMFTVSLHSQCEPLGAVLEPPGKECVTVSVSDVYIAFCWEGLTLAYSAGKNCVINPPGLNQWLFWSSNKNAKSLSPHRQTMHYCVQQRINHKTWQIANVRAVWQKQKSFSALSDNLSKLFLG